LVDTMFYGPNRVIWTETEGRYHFNRSIDERINLYIIIYIIIIESTNLFPGMLRGKFHRVSNRELHFAGSLVSGP